MELNSNTPVEGLWALVCTMQLMSYISMINVDIPSNLNTLIDYMEQVHAFGSVIPNVFKVMARNEVLVMKNSYFKARGYSTSMSMFLCGSDLEMIIVQFSIIPLIGLLYNRIRQPKIKDLLQTLYSKCKYNMPLRTIIVAYVRIGLALMINIIHISGYTGVQILNTILFLISSIAFAFLPFAISIFLANNIDIIYGRHKALCNSFSTLLPINTNSKNSFALHFYPIFLIKRIAFCVTLIVLCKHHYIQLALLLAQSILFILYIIKVQPLDCASSNRSFVIAEIGFISTVGYIFILRCIPMNDKQMNMAGIGGILVIVATIASCWINYLKDALPKIISQIKSYINKSRKKTTSRKQGTH